MFFRPLLDLFFPPLCHVCRAFIPEAGELFICADCLDKVTFLTTPLCTICGAPFATDKGSNHTCGACLLHPPFHTCRSALILEGAVQQLIHRFKYGGRVQLALPLGLLAASALTDFCAEAAPDLIVPVPLHKKRLRQRGYNQSQLIAQVLAKKLKLPVEVGNLRRLRWTEPQTTLDATKRVVNVKGAFVVREARRLEGKRVLLVDDVLTTGSTMRACVDALLRAEVSAVAAVTVARGVQP
ncbi:amidophosphoribosyltransferase, putative [Citrifermentans bemidjiense Bem]|uniref:Amidophosphoribosyltransferase, putative n=1 Tax=Citrifermentans bemidjiense (strain ATCC BAA-1014 / DSM 16622 / JCM 12645 / Bem) TaxID=404380 RepID=B5EEH7_CITBB|nr:ComF family protein [Citrifermentans bemidjiense]ACH40763.1 amidophosphoribosyltransferase, putative [Citrifermentans bemidjiense Bem]